MPELPEVTTMVNDLNRAVSKRTVVDVWTDAEKLVKKPNFSEFKRIIVGRRIEHIRRKGKVIIFTLQGGKILFWHPKLTGHFLIGKWKQEGNVWRPEKKSAAEDPVNRFIHIILRLDNDSMLAFSDLRKFARIELWGANKADKAQIVKAIGVDALEIGLKEFKDIVKKSKKKKIKQLLMEQKLIAGIGNIYSDEILFLAGVHPLRAADSLESKELKKIHQAIKEILLKAIEFAGASVSDFRRISGDKGKFQETIEVYRCQGRKCSKCGTIIERKKLNNRSAHFCPKCQK